MAKRTKEVLTDWYGNPLPIQSTGLPVSAPGISYLGETEEDGSRYVRAYSAGGVPGDRISLEDLQLRVADECGRVLYDSTLPIPEDAALNPGYVGYERDRMLKRLFPR